MKIAIDIRSVLKKQPAGIGYYTLNFIGALAKIDKLNSYILYSKLRPFSKKKKLPPLPGENFKHKKDYFGLGPPELLKAVDVFHSSSFDIKPPKGAKFVFCLHDIIPKAFPQGHTRDTIARMDNLLAGALSLADCIAVDSEATRQDAAKYYPIETKDKLRVIYPGVGEEFSVLSDESKDFHKAGLSKYNIYSDYILYIGTLEPRKNIPSLIKAYHSLKARYGIDQKLVIAGMKGWGWEEIFKLTEELKLETDVIFTGYLPREELVIFYNCADLCVYPSFYEGAGLPVLEAFKCGCPVVTSNVSSTLEFAGEAAVLVDPYSVESIANGIYKVLNNQGIREQLSCKGIKRAEEFTWERTAAQMLEIFNENK